MLKKFSYNYRSLFILFALVWFYGGVLMPGFAKAAPGDPDPTFGTNGVVTENVGKVIIYKLLLQQDGKIIIVGKRSLTLLPGYPPKDYLYIRRYNSNGTSDGTLYWGLTPGIGYDAEVQADGKLVVIGTAPHSFTTRDGLSLSTISPVVWRFNTNGSYDATFGSNGTRFMDTIAVGAYLHVEVFDSRVVVGYGRRTPNTSTVVYRIERLSSVGTLEFGRTLPFATNYPFVMKIDNLTGDILATGMNSATLTGVVRRYTFNNSVVTGFGSNGEAAVLCSGNSSGIPPVDLDVLPDGKILVHRILYGAFTNNIARMTNTGEEDSVCVSGVSPKHDLMVQPDGRFLYYVGIFPGYARHFPDGTFDTNIYNIGPGASAIQPDQKLVDSSVSNSVLTLKRSLPD